jgi:hypothetical protein
MPDWKTATKHASQCPGGGGGGGGGGGCHRGGGGGGGGEAQDSIKIGGGGGGPRVGAHRPRNEFCKAPHFRLPETIIKQNILEATLLTYY